MVKISPPNSRPAGQSPDLLLLLYELLQGQREMVRMYSRSLQSEICLVNTQQTRPELLAQDCPVYTTRELAQIISLSAEEFQRFHHRKTKMVG